MSLSRRNFLKTSAAVAGLAGPLWRPSGTQAAAKAAGPFQPIYRKR